jgi:alpha-amylase
MEELMRPLTPDLAAFCLLSFEGPDSYAQAGGLGVRITHLAETLAERGFETHLMFVGDPDAPGREERCAGRLTLHRWCQHISAYHRAGVYEAEEVKLQDFSHSAPPFLIEQLIRPMIDAGRMPVILAEEWHTADALIRLHDQLDAAGLRRHCVLFWNANNTMSFNRVNWPRLSQISHITTVSRYMKHLMWDMSLNPLVIPNGIPATLLEPVDPEPIKALRHVLDPDQKAIFLFKVGRFDPAKRWLMAIEAAAQLKAEGHQVVFPIRGGVESHGAEVFGRARELGLTITHVTGQPAHIDELITMLAEAPKADVYNLCFPMSQEMLRPFYAAADAVLANSGHEPFGLVGLEAMAARGLVFTGVTGEEYTLCGQSAIVLDTDKPQEIVNHIRDLRAFPERVALLRQNGYNCAAANFTWERISEILFEKIRFVAQNEGVLTLRPGVTNEARKEQKRVQDVVIYTVIHQPRRLRLPAQPLPSGAAAHTMVHDLFDERMNERYFRKVAARCYYPATERFQSLVEQGFKIAIGFSLSFIEQAQCWDPALLERFRKLVQHPNVELVAVEPTHSFVLLWDSVQFVRRMRLAAERLEQIFGVRPVVADTTELMMSDTIYHALELAGFKAAFLDGRPWVMEWREPTHLYQHAGGRLKLLARHYPLSDDVGYRFSDRQWGGWPLMADRYAGWLADSPGDFVVLGWDFETFGEHHDANSGIFAFLEALPEAARRAGLSFATPSEVVAQYSEQSHNLPLQPFASTWAGSGGLEFFLGNEAQQGVYQLMVQAYNKARLTGNQSLVEVALWLAQSDNLHLIQWYGRSGSEAEVSAYFTPQEWWALGADRIIQEIQQVYRNFISALDPYISQAVEAQRAGAERAGTQPAGHTRSVTSETVAGNGRNNGEPAGNKSKKIIRKKRELIEAPQAATITGD